jgi:hypothetical protein
MRHEVSSIANKCSFRNAPHADVVRRAVRVLHELRLEKCEPGWIGADRVEALR